MLPRLLGALLSAMLLALSFPLTLLPLPAWLLELLPYEVVADPALGSFTLPGLPTHLGYLQFPWMAYIALVPLLLAVRATSRSREAFLLGSICGFIWLLFTLLWLVSFGFVPVLLLATYFSLPVGLFAWLAWHLMHMPALPRLQVARLVWGIPLAWVAIEYLRSFGLWSFPWNLLGYTQAAYPVLAQSADIGGVYMVSFLIALANAVAVTLLSSSGTAGLRLAHTGLAALLAAAAYGYGWWRIDHPGKEDKRRPLNFALVQGGLSSLEEWDDQTYIESLNAYTGTTRKLLGLPDNQVASSAAYLPGASALQQPEDEAKVAATETVEPPVVRPVPPGDVLVVWPEGSILKRGGFELEPTGDGIPYEVRQLVEGNPQHALLWGVLGHRPAPPPPAPPAPVKKPEPAAVPAEPTLLPTAPAVTQPAPSEPNRIDVKPVPLATTAEKPARDPKRKKKTMRERPKPPPQPRPKSAAQLARERDLRLVNGSILTTSTGNTWPYSKVRLVPYGEVVPFRGMITFMRFPWNFGGRDLNAGTNVRPFVWRGHRIGALICFDNVFNFIPLAEARAGADYLVLMTNNSWYPMRSGIRQHADIDVLRAIETRRPLLRCSTTGWSQVVDSSGRIIKSTQQRVGVPETLQAAVQAGSGSTIYVRVGDLFAQLCLLLALIIAVPPVVAGRSEGFL